MSHYNYDSELHDLIVGGLKMSDYGADTKITIEYEEDFRTVTTGVDGATSTNEHHNRNAKIKISVLQNSPLNAALTALAYNKKEFPVAYVDRNFTGDVGAFASKSHFVKIPNLEIGPDAKARDWELRAINLKPSFTLK